MLVNNPYENFLTGLTNEQFANEIQKSSDYESNLDYLMGVPDIYILGQFVNLRSRMTTDNDFIPENIMLYNELLRRSRNYARTLPEGSLQRRSFFASAREIDVGTPPREQNRVVRGPPPAPRSNRREVQPNPNNRGVRRNLMNEFNQ